MENIRLHHKEELMSSLYDYAKGPQEPEPNVLDDRSSEYSTCQSNDSAGSIGTSSEHSLISEICDFQVYLQKCNVVITRTTNEKEAVSTKLAIYLIGKLEEIALKHLGTVSENNSTSTPLVNTGNESVNTGRFDPDDSPMPELEIFHKSETGIFDEASYDEEGVITDFNSLPTEIEVSPTPTLRIHNIHPKSSNLRNLNKILKHLQDDQLVPSHAIRLFHVKRLQQVWVLVDLPHGMKVIGNHKQVVAISWTKTFSAMQETDHSGYVLQLKLKSLAAANCCGQVLWVQNQLLDYGFNFMNTKIHIDNESTICIVKNPVYHSKTKHIEIRHHFIRDCYEKKLISVEKIHTDLNVADLLTKPFDGPRFNYLVIFGNMKRGFRGVPRPLLPVMLLVATTNPSAGQEHLDVAQSQPSSSTLPVPSTSLPPVQSPPPITAPIPASTPTPIPKTDPEPMEHTFEEPYLAHQHFSPSQEHAQEQMTVDD
ncbi:hypothetical protein Tco_0820990, partial [Tanacetum coccineum]